MVIFEEYVCAQENDAYRYAWKNYVEDDLVGQNIFVAYVSRSYYYYNNGTDIADLLINYWANEHGLCDQTAKPSPVNMKATGLSVSYVLMALMTLFLWTGAEAMAESKKLPPPSKPQSPAGGHSPRASTRQYRRNSSPREEPRSRPIGYLPGGQLRHNPAYVNSIRERNALRSNSRNSHYAFPRSGGSRR
ncbi:unnamed protein product [Cylicocyclus nassatus]|uniref:Uncharacterized protein n=1 Tax=Cylicocyclus nassatus TaxID=53992 RepID=A0AA36MB29_CYLNA|nr:unnamed protein product [Cylicocyclus nassatus]